MFKDDLSLEVKASALPGFQDAFLDFMLSRKAMMCTKATIEFYQFTLGKVFDWMYASGVTDIESISSTTVRAYLASMISRELSDSYVNAHARAIRTFLRFLAEEEYIEKVPKFRMPKIAKKKLPVLDSSEVYQLLATCTNIRDRVLISFMVDTGIRRNELCAIDWEDVNLENGMINIRKGKGGKSRVVVIGVKTRRLLLMYRRTVDDSDSLPVFQTFRGSRRLKPGGLRSALLKIGKDAGVHISPHILRRTFATLSLRGGMNPLHLQGLLGHSTLEMTRRYVQMVDTDLVKAHKAFGPIDNLRNPT
jgi:site-specific recombinase XerD